METSFVFHLHNIIVYVSPIRNSSTSRRESESCKIWRAKDDDNRFHFVVLFNGEDGIIGNETVSYNYQYDLMGRDSEK